MFFDLRVLPDIVTSAIYCLLENWFDVWTTDCYFIDNDREMFWEDETGNKHNTRNFGMN